MVCLSVRGDNPRAVANISVDSAYYQIFNTKASKGGIKIIVTGQESSADPEGGTGGRDPPLENHKLDGFL